MINVANILLRRAALLVGVVIIAPLVSSCALTGSVNPETPKVSEEEAVASAERLAPEYGYDLFEMELEVLRDVTPWDKRFAGLRFFDQPRYTDIEKKLEGRRYWTLNYEPDFPRYGGSFCVFIDADTGEVMHVFTGW